LKSQVELIASCWTIAGDVYYGAPRETSPHDFRSRVETASAVGYRGIGLFHADLVADSARLGYPAMRKILSDNGMKYVELEIVGDWFADGARRASSDKVRLNLLRAAEQLGAGCVKAFGDTTGGDWPIEVMVDEFRTLCKEAAGAGARVALEYMPFTNIKTPERALEIVDGAGAGNGGLTVDVWHTARGAIGFELIARIPRERVLIVEIDDALAEPIGSLAEDTNNQRKLCGQGVFDIPGFLSAVGATGYVGPIGVEILSEEQRRRPLAEAASAAFETAMTQFAEVPFKAAR